MAFASVLVFAPAAWAAAGTDAAAAADAGTPDQTAAITAEDDGAGQLSDYWASVFPLPGESYGMFPQPFGNPHGNYHAALADDDTQVADIDDAPQQALTPGNEGPDLRDATGQLD